MDGVFGIVAQCGKPGLSKRCVLDLSGLRFMAPGGLTGLVQCVVHLCNQGWLPSVRFPTDDGTAQYLVRMGIRRALRGRARCLGAPRGRRRYGHSTALVELTTIQKTGDVDALLDGLTDSVADILEEQLGYSGADVGNFTSVISELSRNIIDHSGAIGFVAAQRYTAASRTRFALISVGDVGVGLRETLGQRYPVSGWSDAEVIIRALMRDYSRYPNRGLGLALVRKVCQDYRGSLHIRSSTCRIYVRGRKTVAIDAGWFPGTQVAISLQQKQD